jgi:IS5 family transposase
MMKTKDGFIQGYNAQLAVDAESQVIVACGLTQSAADVHELIPMVQQIKENTGRQAKELSADAGFCSEENLKELSRRHIRGYIATGRQKHGQGSATEEIRAKTGVCTGAMRLRLQRAGHRSRYRLRKQTVEPVIGQIKEPRGFRRFLLRGVEKVTGEWNLICTAHNFLKWAAAIG